MSVRAAQRPMEGLSAEGLIRMPVRVRGIQLGRVADVVLDVERRRALGLEVACGDEERRFLPLAVAELDRDALRLASPLLLLDPGELAFYTGRGSTFAALRGTSVVRGRTLLGALVDLRLEPDGAIPTIAVRGEDGVEDVRYDERVRLGAPGTHVLAL